MKTQLYSVITRLVFVILIALPNSFAQDNLAQPSVRLVYFLPNDRPARPEQVLAFRQLSKDAQQFFADEMQRHGFGRKTFAIETDEDGEPVVHRINGKFTEEHYANSSSGYKVRKETYEYFGNLQDIYFVAIDLSSEILNGGYSCGEANVTFFASNGGMAQGRGRNITQGEEAAGGSAVIPASGDCFERLGLTVHELGHAFGLVHDFREGIDSNYVMAYGNQELSICTAEWLSVSPFFNTNPSIHNTQGAIRLISSPMYSPDGIKLRFEVTDTDGLHHAQLLVVKIVEGGGSVGTYRDYRLFDCKQLNGETSTIEFISEELTVEPVDRIALQIIDVNGRITWATFAVDIASILPDPQVVSIPDANLAAVVRTELGLEHNVPITDREMKKLRNLEYLGPDLRDDQKIGDLTGLEAATNLEKLNLYANQIRDLSPLAGLQKLSTLTLPNNQIEDISPLEGLKKLKRLWLTNNQIENINSLKKIPQSLEILDLGNNPIKDFNPIAGFVNLTWLGLYSNRLGDSSLELITKFTQLERLELRYNQIRNISPLTKLTNLRWLYIEGNEISDVRPLTRLTKLEELRLEGNPIKNREPLLEMLRRNPDIKIYLKAGGDPLPVSLSHFRAELTDAGVIIKWITESEVDNAGFNILRSETKNGEFKIVNPALIQGAGTTSERQTYTWTDTTAKPNVVYYYQIEDISHAGVRKQLATVRLKGYVSAAGKLTTRWGALKLQE